MTQGLDFNVQFMATDRGSEAERASFGELTVRAGDFVLTEVVDTLAQTTRSSIFVSLNHLARWLADHWWRLRWEPTPGTPSVSWRLAHEIGAAGGGFVWPRLRFESDGETITLYSKPTSERHTVRYIAERHEFVCDASAFERGVDHLVSQVLSRLSARGAHDAELEETWQSVLEERRDEELSAFRRHEAYMGLNPGEVDPEDLGRLFSQGAWLGKGGLDETLAGAAGQDVKPLLSQLTELRKHASAAFSFERIAQVVGKWEEGSPQNAEPWQRGGHLARHLRQEWELGDGPVTDEFLNYLLKADIHSDEVSADDIPFLLGFRDDNQVRPVLRKSPFKAGRRFAVARLIADAAVASTSDAIHPLTGARTARQKFQRAAAQEFLCPVESLQQRVSLPEPTEDELVEAADYFQVSPYVVKNTLVNKSLVSRDYLPE